MRSMVNDEVERSAADRVLILEVKQEQTERRLNECAAATKWIVGLLGVIAVGLFVTFAKQGGV